MSMKFQQWLEGVTFRGYGGPKFDFHQYESEFESNQYHTYQQLYHDVQLELDNLSNDINRAWRVGPKDLIWFEDEIRNDPFVFLDGH